MKRFYFLAIFFYLLVSWTFAAHVDVQIAKTVGGNFLSTLTTGSSRSSSDLQLVYCATSNRGTSSETYFYVFQDAQGFVIVAGDDRSIPILAYSDEGIFDSSDMPPNAKKWLEGYKVEIRQLIADDVSQPLETRTQWERYVHGETNSSERAATVSPLINLTWSQSPYYNALCPGGSVTGCVATAMAQIMKFWNYPATGSGFHSYNHNTYGTVSANFGSTTYDWSAMPANVTSSNNAVATLMYHCGVSVDMDYSPQVSGAYVISAASPVQHCSEYALKTYFGYSPSMHGEERDNYNENQWISMLKTELDASRPILYAGFGSGGGHCFVADGYDNSNFFHFNWGWAGAYNGYFAVGALNPSGTGTGGGTGGYNSGQQVLIGIQPPSGGGGGGGVQTFNMTLYDYVYPSASTIYYGEAFTVSSNIANQGQNIFTGDYCAAVFDSQGNFTDYVQILTGNILPSGNYYNNGLTFSTNGLLSMLPGTYTIGIFYKPTGGNWIVAADYGGYYNGVQIEVINPNYIELNSTMNVSPGTTVVQGQNLSVNLDLVNEGGTDFYGSYMVALYELDGSFGQNIGTLTESGGLPPGYSYSPPYLTFTNSVTVAPGTYLLAATHLPDGTNDWQITGSSYYQNPIYVTVQAPALTPDQYETNNVFNERYTLPINFSGNNATVTTTGSTLHTGEDNDFYRIDLDAGYDYTISSRVHDSYSSGNGNTYTVDALFSYSTDGNTWSDAYDDVMPGTFNLNNGGTITYHVAPYFAGETGTYLLDVNISRSPSTGISQPEPLAGIRTYPNPAVDRVTIDLNGTDAALQAVELMALDGKILQTMSINSNEKLVTLSLNELAAGVYFLRLTTDKGITVRKLMAGK